MKLPNKVFGIETEEAYARYLEKAKKEPERNADDKETGFSPISLENPKDYVQVPGIKGIHRAPVVISKYEAAGMNNMNYENTHRAVFQLGKGLYIPPPGIFMPHFKNVVSTYKNNQPLLDAEGNPIRREEHGEIYKHLTTNFKDIYGANHSGAWTWLNARFVPGTGFNGLDLETIIGIKPDKTFETKKEPLIQCLDEDKVYADLIFNTQGLSIKKSTEQNYKQGENLRYRKPIKGRVARFGADSNGAGVICYRDPEVSGSALGVFLCAEGASKNRR